MNTDKRTDCFGNKIQLGSLITASQHQDSEMEIGVVTGFSNLGVRYNILKFSRHMPDAHNSYPWYSSNIYTSKGWWENSQYSMSMRSGSTNARIIVLPKSYLSSEEKKTYKKILKENDLLQMVNKSEKP